MIKAIVSDFSRVVLFPKDKKYAGTLNQLHKDLSLQSNYKPLDYFDLNNELLDYYRSLKDKLKLYIFTSDVIQEAPEFQPFLQPIFNRVFSASKMNTNKKDPEAYKKIIADLNLLPTDILYIDDNTENINAAANTGLHTILYQNNQQLFREIIKEIE